MDPAAALGAAHRALAAGDAAEAFRQAEALVAQQPALVPARQLAAAAARRLGRTDAALAHLDAALRLAPHDPDVLNGHGNLMMELGDAGAARRSYEAALATAPGLLDARVNLALACKRAGDRPAAHAALDAVLAVAPRHRRALQTRAALQLEEGDAAAAGASLDAALAEAPNDLRLLGARAQVEGEAGGDPRPFLARARAVAPADLDLRLAEGMAADAAGEAVAAETLLSQLTEAEPGYEPAHAALARLRWRHGAPDRFTESYERALARRPGDAALWLGLLGALMRAGRPCAVLERLAAARPALGPTADALEAAAATEAGDQATAAAAFARLDPASDHGLRIAYLRHLARTGQHRAATEFALPLAAGGDAALWPYLSIAWRMLGDPRAEWLEGDPAFVGVFDLPLSAAELSAAAEVLRSLHLARAAPFDQTLRGGAQTEGALLGRREPEIRRLRRAFEAAVAEHLSRLPPTDPGHPLLAPPRTGFRIAGSWSVRLTDAGFHVNHVHPEGWLSSACYVALPPGIGRGDGDESGWLTLGEPPAELEVDLPPRRAVQPRPGRLVLFPSTLWHGTRPFAAGERLTVAFDVVPD